MVWVSEPPTVMVADRLPAGNISGGNVPSLSNRRGPIWLGTSWNITVALTASGQTYTVDINAGTNPNITINWGDGVVEQYRSTGQKIHTYLIARTVTVQIRGEFASGGNIRLGSNAADCARVKGTSAIPFIKGLANFMSTFQNCTGLSTIPSDLFQYNTTVAASGFYRVFSGCTGLTSLPTNLFRRNPAVSTSGFREAFYGCTGLISLPTDLFQYNPAVAANGFNSTFLGCTGLTSLPEDLFRYNTVVPAINQTFSGCSGLTSLPANLFRYNTSLAASAFNATFRGCTGLTSVPTDLFRYNTAVSTLGFSGTFHNCTNLTSLPANLFRYNTLCVSFLDTFYNCIKLQQNANIFYADGEQATRFLNQTVDFTCCFYLSSFTGTTGVAPDLWNCNFGTGAATKTDCWQGHSASTVSNFADIPAAWV